MWFTYVDDAGDPEFLPSATTNLVTPLFVIGAVALDQAQIHSITTEFLALKRRFFPHLAPRTRHLLDWVRPEMKGTELKRMMRSPRKRERRTATTFVDKTLRLLEDHDARIFGRVWVKAIGVAVDKQAMTSFSIQDCCATFQKKLEELDQLGVMIVDSSSPRLNASVSHSAFTQKYKASGDAYDRLLEMPVFGHSENHVGLQLADIVSSALLFPIASFVYCTGHVTSVHVNPYFSDVKTRFAQRVKALQHRYYDDFGRRRGGIVVSDKIANRPGSLFFR